MQGVALFVLVARRPIEKVVAALADILGLQTVLMGFGLPDDNLHAPNEKLDLECFARGIETVIVFLERLPEETAQ